MQLRDPVKQSLWNKLVFWLLKKPAQVFNIFNGPYLDYYDNDDRLTINSFSGKPIKGPQPGLVHWFIWAFFKNELDGEIGDKNWNPQQKDTWMIRVKWWFRNPCHNFTWHVIGFADKNTKRFDFQKEDGPGWNYAMTYVPGNESVYPFFLYHGKVWTFYIGWRGRGTFGIKFNK